MILESTTPRLRYDLKSDPTLDDVEKIHAKELEIRKELIAMNIQFVIEVDGWIIRGYAWKTHWPNGESTKPLRSITSRYVCDIDETPNAVLHILTYILSVASELNNGPFCHLTGVEPQNLWV